MLKQALALNPTLMSFVIGVKQIGIGIRLTALIGPKLGRLRVGLALTSPQSRSGNMLPVVKVNKTYTLGAQRNHLVSMLLWMKEVMDAGKG